MQVSVGDMLDDLFAPMATATERIESAAHLGIFLNSLADASDVGRTVQAARQLGPFAPRIERTFDHAYRRASEFILDPSQVGTRSRQASKTILPFFSHTSQAIPASFRWTLRHPTRALQAATAINDIQANTLGEDRNGLLREPWSPLALTYDVRPDGRMLQWEIGRSAELFEAWPLIIGVGAGTEQIWKAYRGSDGTLNTFFGSPDDILTGIEISRTTGSRVAGVIWEQVKGTTTGLIDQSIAGSLLQIISETDQRGYPIVYPNENEFFQRFSEVIRPLRTLERTGLWRKLFGHHNIYNPNDPNANEYGIVPAQEGLLGGPATNTGLEDWTSREAVDTLFEDMFGFKMTVVHPTEVAIRGVQRVDTWYSEQTKLLGDRANELLRRAGNGEDVTVEMNRLVDDYQYVEELMIWKANMLADYQRRLDTSSRDSFFTRQQLVDRIKLFLGEEVNP